MVRHGKSERCVCPYCDAEISEDAIFCVACEMVFVSCEKCGMPMRNDATVCPSCGNEKRS